MEFADTGVMVAVVVGYVNLSDLGGTALLSLNLHGKRKHRHWFYAYLILIKDPIIRRDVVTIYVSLNFRVRFTSIPVNFIQI